jgi:hypothetical protein
MTPAAIIATARQLGVSLVPDGSNIRIRPAGKLPPDVRAALVAQKPALLAVLRGTPAPDACSECGSTSWTVSLVDESLNRTCHDCLTGRTALRRSGASI